MVLYGCQDRQSVWRLDRQSVSFTEIRMGGVDISFKTTFPTSVEDNSLFSQRRGAAISDSYVWRNTARLRFPPTPAFYISGDMVSDQDSQIC